jgi:hypothetical protein
MIEINGVRITVTQDDEVYVVARYDNNEVLFELEAPMEGIDLLIALMKEV